jgi:SAM-dependent methyltransferase
MGYAEYVRLQVERSLVNRGYDPGDRARHLIAVLRRYLPPDGSRRVLCVGCRNTHELDYLAEAGYPGAEGIDLHSIDPRIRVMDMHAMSWADGSFDAIYACHSLEHAYDPATACGEFVRVLRPGGLVVAEVPIGCERRKGDLWDFQDPQTVADLLGGRILWSETGPQLGANQHVARVLVRVNEP